MSSNPSLLGPSAAIAAQKVYAVARHPAPLDLYLDANEGGRPPPALLAALGGKDTDELRRYPRPAALEAALARHYGVKQEELCLTCGVDDALDRACRALLDPSREVVLPWPTFEMLPRYIAWSGAKLVEVDWPEGPYPLAAVEAAVTPRTAAIFVVSPNNPTGAVATGAELAALSRAAPHAMLLVDLAYAEFADEDLTRAALALPNAIAFRTLSKAWGLAGLRVGVALGRPEHIGWLRTAGHPFGVSSASIAIALARLEMGDAGLADYVARVRVERTALAALLRELGAHAPASQGNFVLCRPRDPLWLRDGLAGLGIGVRAWPGNPKLGALARVTCPGDPATYARLEAALRAVLRPEAVLFDMDGVLADVSQSYRRAIVETAASFGVALSAEDVARGKAAGGANNDWELTRRLCAERGVEAPLAEVMKRFERLYQGTADAPGLWRAEPLIPTRALCERLARRVKLGIVTGRPRADAERFLATHGVRELFGALVCMEDGPLKPDPAPVRTALDELGVTSAWLVGDTPDDVAAARAAGVVPVGFAGHGDATTQAALGRAGAAVVLESLDRLEGLLA
ncbi:MAG: TIGR01548 family HAD-type hydrolase [Polyangiaceae bacterium]|nr:TIGR01548 family HAD-type hydrolase [Polyangiaceae bacterium]